MTPQIFVNLLRSAYFAMEQVGLLIIDECHHTANDHPYNCVIREFYKPYDRFILPPVVYLLILITQHSIVGEATYIWHDSNADQRSEPPRQHGKDGVENGMASSIHA